jgi:NADH-quinone oxidoreductase subunit D
LTIVDWQAAHAMVANRRSQSPIPNRQSQSAISNPSIANRQSPIRQSAIDDPQSTLDMFDTNELVINMGPQHPSTHGVLRVVLRLDGERVKGCDVVIGYLHRGIEKLCEQRDWAQIVLITDRMDYVAAASNNLGYCETVEKLMSIEVPRRAQYIRTVLAELQRIASHCIWLGTHAMDIGAMTVFLYAFRERELALDLFEEYCGARLTYNAMRIGGLPLDIPPGWDRKVRAFCDVLDEKVVEYEELLTRNRIWRDRTRTVGVISGPDAIAIGLSGPALRGSGVMRDIRKDEPYAAYADFEFDVPLGLNGDTYDRYLVRVEEFRQSTRIIRQALDGLPEGPVIGKVPRLIKPPAGETYHAIESPKGEIGYFIASDGKSNTPYRFRVRPPSFCNLQALPQLVQGHLVADVVALIGSIDIVLGEVDR